jgi:hypothetical protein
LCLLSLVVHLWCVAPQCCILAASCSRRSMNNDDQRPFKILQTSSFSLACCRSIDLGMDRGHERRQSLVAGRQCRGSHLSRTSALTPCNRGLFPPVCPRSVPRPTGHKRV